MKKILKIVFAVYAIVILAGCEKESSSFEGPRQRIYYMVEFINFAWGEYHNGFLIDSSGNVLCFDKPDVWKYQDTTGFISSADMNVNISAADSICYRIDEDELDSRISLIYEASNGEISPPEHEMYDAGVITYYGYLYNEKTKTYKAIILRQWGDVKIENRSPAADALYLWLRSVRQRI